VRRVSATAERLAAQVDPVRSGAGAEPRARREPVGDVPSDPLRSDSDTCRDRRYSEEPDERAVTMPLSEHEQRMFAEIERQLVEDDPRFVARTRRRLAAWSPEVRLRGAIVLGVMGLLGVFALTFDLVFGVIGMALLLTAILVGASAANDRTRALQHRTPPDGR